MYVFLVSESVAFNTHESTAKHKRISTSTSPSNVKAKAVYHNDNVGIIFHLRGPSSHLGIYDKNTDMGRPER
jgi:hypothetical protein